MNRGAIIGELKQDAAGLGDRVEVGLSGKEPRFL